MRYTKTAIGLLTAQYRSVLKKCWLINVGLFALGASMVPSQAEAKEYKDPSDGRIYETGVGTGLICYNRTTGNFYYKYEADGCDAATDDVVAIVGPAQENGDGDPTFGHKYDIAPYSTAIGRSATATNASTVAVGNHAEASGWAAVSVGVGSTASGHYSIALGNSAQAIDVSAVALGRNALSSGDGSVAIGPGAQATEDAGVSIGMSAESAHNSIGIGRDASALGEGSFALGHGAEATGRFAVAIGNKENGDDTNMHAISFTPASTSDGGYSQAYATLRDYSTASYKGGHSVESDKNGGYYYYSYYDSPTPVKTVNGVDYYHLVRQVHAYKDADLDGNPDKVSITYYWADEYYGDDIKEGDVLVHKGVYGTYYEEGAGSLVRGAVAIGNMAQAGYIDSGNNEVGIYSLALGYGSKTGGDYALAQGYNAKANAAGASAIGVNAEATGSGSVAVGQAAKSSAASAVAIGYNAQASNTGANAIGFNTKTKEYSTAIGYATEAQGKYSTAIGSSDGTKVSAMSDIPALQTIEDRINDSDPTGTTSDEGGGLYKFTEEETGHVTYYRKLTNQTRTLVDGATGSKTKYTNATTYEVGLSDTNLALAYSVAGGYYADANDYIIVKNAAKASGQYAVAIGNATSAGGNYSIAMGYGATANNAYATAIGYTSAANNQSTALGYNARATGSRSAAFGYQARATSDTATAVGYTAEASGLNSTALGYNAHATGAWSFAEGNGSQAMGSDSIAIGYTTVADGSQSLAMVYTASVYGNDSLALGYGSNVGTSSNKVSQAIAIGKNAEVYGTNSIALGYGASAGTTSSAIVNAVALGFNSKATDSDTISVGNSTYQRRIMYVDEGTEDTDAVNVSQLNSAIADIDFPDPYTISNGLVLSGTDNNTLSARLGNGLEFDTSATDGKRPIKVKLNGSTLNLSSSGLKISDGGVGTTQLAGDAVTSAKIKDGEVKTDDIAALNVTKGKLENLVQNNLLDNATTGNGLTITNGTASNAANIALKLNGDTLEATTAGLHVKAGGITATELATNAVETEKIKALNVTKGKLENLVQNNLLDNATTGNGLTITNGTASNAANIALKLNGDTLEATTAGLHVKASGITTTEILNGTIINEDIADSTIATGKLASVSNSSVYADANDRTKTVSNGTLATTASVWNTTRDLLNGGSTWTGANTFKNNSGITIQNTAGTLSTQLTAGTGNILNVSGGETVGGKLTVSTGGADITGNSKVTGAFEVTGNETVGGNSDIAGSLKVGSSDQFQVTSGGAVSTTSTLTADGESKFAKDNSSVYTLDVTTTEAKVANGKTLNVGDNTASSADAKFDINGSNYVTGIDSGTNTPTSNDNRTLATLKTVGATAAAILDGTNNFTKIKIDNNVYEAVDDGSTKYLAATGTSGANDTLATTKTVQETIKDLLGHTGTGNVGNIWTANNTFGDADTDLLDIRSKTTFYQDNGGTAKHYKTVVDGQSITMYDGAEAAANKRAELTENANGAIFNLLTRYGKNGVNIQSQSGTSDINMYTGNSNSATANAIALHAATNTTTLVMTNGGDSAATSNVKLAVTNDSSGSLLKMNGASDKTTIEIDSADSSRGSFIRVSDTGGIALEQIDKNGIRIFDSQGETTASLDNNLVNIKHNSQANGEIILSRNNATNVDNTPMVDLKSHANGGDLLLNNKNGKSGIELKNDVSGSNPTSTIQMYAATGTGNSADVVKLNATNGGSTLIMTNGGASGTPANRRVVVTSNNDTGTIELKDVAGNNQVVLDSTKGTTEDGTNALQVINTQLAGRESGNSALNVNVNANNNIITVGSNDHDDIFNVEAVMSLNGDVNIGNEDTDRLNVRSYTTFYQDKRDGETLIAEKYYQTIADGQKFEMYAGTEDTAYEGVGALQNRRMALSQSDTGAVFDLLNSKGKDGIHLSTESGVSDFNMYTGNTANASNQAISMHASPTTTAGVNNGTSLVMTNGGARDATNTKFEIYNDATGSKVLMGNGTGADTIQIYSSDPNSANNGKIIVNEIVSSTVTPVVVADHNGLTITGATATGNGGKGVGKTFTLGDGTLPNVTSVDPNELSLDDDYNDGNDHTGNKQARDKFVFNGRSADTFSASDSIFYNGHYGDEETIASTKSVADALGTLSGTNYLVNTQFGNKQTTTGPVNTVAANLMRIDAKIDTWTDQYHNITTSQKSNTDALTATPTIGDTFEAIDKAIGTVQNGSYVKTYDGTDSTSIAGNIKGLDTQLYITDYGMQQNTANLAQLRAEVGYKSGLDISNKNLTYGANTAPANIVTAINNLSYTVGKIHGLANSNGSVNSGNSTVGNNTNLNYKAKTVSEQLVALDNAIDAAKTRITTNEGNIGNMTFTNTHYIYNDGDLSSAVRTLDGQVYTNEQDIISINNTIQAQETDLTHIKNGMGGSFTGEDGAWTAQASTYWKTIQANSLMQAIDNVSNTIGTAEQLSGAGNGIKANQTVNQNLKAVSGALTTEIGRAVGVEGLLENLTGRAEGKENLVEAINALDSAITNISGDIIDIGSDFGDLSDLTHNAFKPKSSSETLTKATNRAVTNIANGMGGEFGTDGKWSGTASTYYSTIQVDNLMDAVDNVSNTIGTADQLSGAGNGISASNTVNANLKALSGSLTNEVNRAKGVEGNLNELDSRIVIPEGKDTNLVNAINAETARAVGAETQLATDITTERTRAMGVEGVIGNLSGHALGSTNLVDAVNAVDGALNSEINRATVAEGALDTKIGEEKARAEGAEADLNTAITNEVTRAKAAEGSLSFQTANGNFNQTTTKTLTDAVNALDTSIGSRADLTYNAISDNSTLAKAINSLAVNVGTGMGGTFNAETGAWSGSVNTYMSESPYQFTSVMGAVQHISDTIGTKAHLGYATGVEPKNGLDYRNTVNQNLAALNSAIGDVHSFSEEEGYTNKAKNATDVVDAITKIDTYVSNMSNSMGDLSALQHPAFGTITSSTTFTQATNTAVTNLATGMGGSFAPVTGVWSGSIQTYRDQSAVGVSSIMDAVDHVVDTIGTAADLGHTALLTPVNGVSSSNTVNKNIGIINSKLGNVANFAGDTYTGAAKGATTSVEAITKIDNALSGEITRATTTEGNLAELEGPAAGKTNLVAAINAINGSVTNLGDTINTQGVDLTHIKNGMGGSFTGEGGAWTAQASTYWKTIQATSLMQAIDNVSNTIGTAAQLNNAGNGVLATNTVNQNLKAVSGALTAESERAVGKENEIAGNLTAEITRATTAEDNLNTAITTVDGRVTTLNNTVTNLSTKVTNMGVGMGGTLSDTGVWSGTVQTYRDSEPKAVTSLMGAVNHVINTIGTASELGTANGVSASNTVNKNIGAVSGALTAEINRATTVEGNLDELTVTIPSGTAKNLVNAINAVNGSVTNLNNTINGQAVDLTHIKVGMGGSFDDETGVWSARASTYYNTIDNATSIMQAVDNVSNTIGTAAHLNGAGNGVSANQTVNQNIKAVSSALTVERNRALAVEGNLDELTGKAAGKESLVEAINAIDGAVTNIEGNVTTLTNNYTQLNSTVTDLSNSYNTLNNTVNILDGEVGDLTDLKHNAISDKSTITKAVNSLAVNVNQGMGGTFAGDGTWSASIGVTTPVSYGAISSASSITDALTQINSNIGKATDLGNSPLKNGLSTSNSVNTNIKLLNTAIGDVSRFKATDYAGTIAKNSTNVVQAVERLDEAFKTYQIGAGGNFDYFYDLLNQEIQNRTDGDTNLNEYITNIDNRVGNKADMTHKAFGTITDATSITEAVDTAAWNIGDGMGGTFANGTGDWSGTVEKDGTLRYGDFDTTSLLGALTDVSSTIGTEADLGYDAEHPEVVPANGVSKTKTVNQNIAALNTAITNLDDNVVHTTGDESVAGVKTFSDNLVANGGITTTTLTASGLAKLSGGNTGGLQFDNGQVVKSIATTIGNGSNEALATTSAVKNYVGTGVLSVKMNGTVNSTTFGANDSENALIDLGAIVTNVAEGTTNGTISVTQNGATGDVKVHGLGSAAYTDSTSYATYEQGEKADSALQGVKVNNSLLTVADDKTVNITVAEGTADGSIKVNGTDVDVHGLKGGAFKDVDTEVTASSTNLVTSGAVSTALGNKVDKTRTINNKDLTTDIVLDGTDIKLTGYAKPANTSAIAATDSVNTAIGKLEAGLDGKYDKTGGLLSGDMWFAENKGIKYGDITVTGLATAISNNPTNTKFVTEKAVSDYVGTGDLKLTINGVQKTAFNANADDDLAIDLGSYVTQQQGNDAKGKVLTVNAETGMVEATQIANTMLTDNSITKNKFVTEVKNSLDAADSALQGVKINGTALPKSTTDKTVNIEAVVHGTDITFNSGTAEEPVYTNDGKLATSQAVREYVSELDTNLVHKTGAETIGGVKTFSNNIVANGGIGTTTLTASGLTTLSGGDTGGLQFGNGQVVKSIATTIGDGSNEALATTSAVKSYVGDKNLTIKVNGTNLVTFNANEATEDKVANIDLSAYQTSNIGTEATDKNKVVITNGDGDITTSTVTTDELNLLSTAVSSVNDVTAENAGKLIKVGAIKSYVDNGLDTKYDKTGGLLSGDMWFAENKGIKYGDITVTDLATTISSNPVHTKFVTEKAVSDYVGKGDLKLTINGVEKTAFNANTNTDLAIDLGSYVTQQQPNSAKGKVLTVNAETGMVEATQIANSMIVDESITKNKFVTSVQNSLDAADSALQGVRINNGAPLTVADDKTVNIEAVVHGTEITANSGTAEEPVYTNDGKLATSQAVREYVSELDTNLVHKTGAETIGGVKTFSNNIVANGGVTTTTVDASSNVTAGGLVISNGSGQTAYTSQTIDKIDSSTSATAPLTSGSDTTMATTNTVFNTVGDVTTLNSGIFAESANTVVGKLSALKDAIHDAGGDITDLVAKFYNVTSGSDKFDGNEWKANVSTYLETREVNNILGAADVVSDTIGTAVDLGYDEDDPEVVPANGVSKDKTVNANISALNTALSTAQTKIDAIDGDYVTKRELHGKTGESDTVNVGENAANINIGAATAGITIDTTTNNKTVDIAGDTITLDSQVVINKADRSTTFGNNGTTVQIKDGAITATGNTTTAGLVIKNVSGDTTYTSQTINKIDNTTGVVDGNSSSTTTMATTATVFNTVGNIKGLNDGVFENTTTVADKLGALNGFIGDKSALGNDASNGISDKTKVTNAISSLATHVGQGLGGSFDSTSGEWSGSIQTYRDTSAYSAESVMDAISHVSSYAIGSVEDLGYSDTVTTLPNGLSKANSVNSNLAALNTALSTAQETLEAIGNDYVTKRELHGQENAGDTVNVGEYAATTNIGTEDAGIVITNTNTDKTVQITGSTISLGDDVTVTDSATTINNALNANGGISTTTLTASGLTTLSGGDTGGLQFGNGQVVKSIATTIGNGSDTALATTSAVKSYVGDKNLTIKVNNATVGTFNANESTEDKVVNIDLSAYQTSNIGTTDAAKNKVVITDGDGDITTSTVTTDELNLLSTAVSSADDVTAENAGKLIKVGAIKTYVDNGLDTKYDKTGGLLSGDMWFAENKGIKYGDITVTGLATEISNNPVHNKFVTEKAVYDYVTGVDANVVHKTGDEEVAGEKTFSDSIVANGGVEATTVEVSGLTTLSGGNNGGLQFDDGQVVKSIETTIGNGSDTALATTSAVKGAITTSETNTRNWVKGDEGAQTANFTATGTADDNVLVGEDRNIAQAINYLGTQTYDLKQTIEGDYVTKVELHGKNGQTGDNVTVGEFADTTTIGTADAGIKVDTTTNNKKVDVTANTINLSSNTVNLGSKVTVNGQTGETTFEGSGTNSVSINNGAITATGNTTTGGLVISNGSGQDAYTSQTINRIDNSTTALTSGSTTTMATTATVFNTVGDVTTLNEGVFEGSTNTVVGKLSVLGDAVDDAKTDITYIKNSTGGEYDPDTGVWSATASTYKGSITAHTMMQAVNHVSNTIGSVTDLGYASETATGDLANGISRNNTVNQNIAALNSAIGDLDDLTVDTGTGDKNIVKAINKVNNIVNNEGAKITNITAGGTFDDNNNWSADVSTYKETRTVHSILEAVDVVSDTIGTAAELANAGNGVSATKTVNANISALSGALTEAKQAIEGYVTKEELYGKDGQTGDEVKVGNYADKVTIGTEDAGIVVNNTEGNKTVQITGDTINLGDQVSIQDGTVSAAGIELGGNTADSIDTGEAPITAETASSTTLATTATVLATANVAASEAIKDTFGGELDEDGKWSAQAKTYYSQIKATKFMEAVDNVSNTIGTKEDLGEAKNGVSAKKTVNANIAAVNSSLGKINGLVAKDGSVNSTTVDSTVGTNSNLKGGTTVEDYLVSLDNAVGNRNYASTNVVKAGSSAADAISALDKSLGSAADLNRKIDASAVQNNGVSADNSVNANVAALNSAIGEVSKLKNTYWVSEATNVTDAVVSLDEQLHNMGAVVNDIAYKVDDMRKEMRNGLASAAALSALVPNARSTGKTSLSLGTGGYKGASAVAVGGFHYFTDNLLMNVGASWGKSDMMYRVGMTYTF